MLNIDGAPAEITEMKKKKKSMDFIKIYINTHRQTRSHTRALTRTNIHTKTHRFSFSLFSKCYLTKVLLSVCVCVGLGGERIKHFERRNKGSWEEKIQAVVA
jgi:hypothetical protein